MKRKLTVSVATMLLLPALLAAQQRDSVLTTSSSVAVGSEVLENTSGVDLRSRLTGRLTGLQITEHNGQTSYTSTNLGTAWLSSGAITAISKGWGTQALYIDGVPVPFSQFLLDPIQIESVEYISDAHDKNAMIPISSQGAVVIHSRRGAYNTPIKVESYVEGGFGFVDKMPGWSDGVTYARLNNQARQAAGYTPLYSDEAIAGYAAGNMYDKYYPNVDYRSLILRDWKPITRLGISAGGGTAGLKYHMGIGGLYDGDIYKVGPASDFSKINFNMSVTAKIGRWIEAGADFLGLIAFRRSNGSSLYAWRSVPAIAFPVVLGLSSGDSGLDDDRYGTTVYTVSRAFPSNPYAATVDGGFATAKHRSGLFKAHVDIDFGFLLKGLKSQTVVSFGQYYNTNIGKSNDYLAYYWDASDYLVDLSSHVGVKAASKSTKSTFSYQRLHVQEDLTYTHMFGDHYLGVNLSGYLSNGARSGNAYYEKLLSAHAGAKWSWKNRYAASATLQCSAAPVYAKGHRAGFFPSGAFVWNVTAEPFMKKAGVVQDLRVIAQAGLLPGADVFGSNYQYQASYDISNTENFGPATAYQWFGVDKQTVPYTNIARFANPELTWPKIAEYDLGARARFAFGLEAGIKGYFINKTGGIANTMANYSLVYGWNGTALYENYTASRTAGYEVDLRYAFHAGPVEIALGAMAMGWKTIDTRVVSDNWNYPWQKLTGADANAIRGYKCIGRFENEAQIASEPKIDEFGTQVGDLRYQDLNGDGVINENDRCIIGNSCPRLRYSLSLDVKWKDLELNIVGGGKAFYSLEMTNEYFWSGWGDGLYSDFVAENIGGDYPRLSYEKSTTNFVASDFWLRKGGFFKLDSACLSYTLHFKKEGAGALKFSLTGGNLFTLTRVKYVDPEAPSAGITAYPFFRTVMAGVKYSF